MPAGRRPDRGHRGIELAAACRGQRRVGAEHLGQAAQPLLGALDQFSLELDEAIDHPRPRHHVDLVEAELDPRIAVTNDPLAAELPDRDELEQRRVARVL
ncbi:MAG TPA: hypothetical protein VIM25_01815, partial [Candidatus Limnocylindrales bacterium]